MTWVLLMILGMGITGCRQAGSPPSASPSLPAVVEPTPLPATNQPSATLVGPIAGEEPPASPAWLDSHRFKIETSDHTYWLVQPGGEPFFPLGICSVHHGIPIESYDASNPAYCASRFYATEEEWADATLRRLTRWRFSNISGWADWDALRESTERLQTFTPALHAGVSAGYPWVDMWDPSRMDAVEDALHELIVPFQDDPRLLGYFPDNELGWWNGRLFEYTLEQKPEHGQRQLLLAILKSRYPTWEDLLKDFEPVEVNSFADLEQRGQVYLKPGSNGIAAYREFLTLLAQRYYRLMSDLLDRLDGRGLNLGDRYHSCFYPEVARAAGPWVDAISSNVKAAWTDGSFPRFYLDTLHNVTHRPIIVSEFYMAAMENQSGNLNTVGGFPVVPTQKDRAASFLTSLKELARHPAVIGADWFQFYDEPPGGRYDGEDFNMGMVDIHNQPYRRMVRAAQSLDLVDYRKQEHPERGNVRSGVPLAPEYPLAPVKPRQLMAGWDRDQGFVPPATLNPLADLYVCWNPEGLYVGAYALNLEEPYYYKDQQVPPEDRLSWNLRFPEYDLRIDCQLGQPVQATQSGTNATDLIEFVTVADATYQTLVVSVPASLFGHARLEPKTTVQMRSDLHGHCGLYPVNWEENLTLVD